MSDDWLALLQDARCRLPRLTAALFVAFIALWGSDAYGRIKRRDSLFFWVPSLPMFTLGVLAFMSSIMTVLWVVCLLAGTDGGACADNFWLYFFQRGTDALQIAVCALIAIGLMRAFISRRSS